MTFDKPASSISPHVLDVEALVFSAGRPVFREEIESNCPGIDFDLVSSALLEFWSSRGINVESDGASLRLKIRPEVAIHLQIDQEDGKRLTTAGMETLAVIAMHQPVTLQDIERFRGVKLSKGIMEALISADLVRLALRRTDSGRAAVYMTTDTFLERYGLGSLADLPRPEEIPDLVDPPRDGPDDISEAY